MVENLSGKSTVAFVYGALANGSTWCSVTGRVLGRGFAVVSVANTLGGLVVDATHLASALGGLGGSVVGRMRRCGGGRGG